MADQTNINQPGGEAGNSNVMRELSDIKESLATNTEATKNMKDNITEIKADIKEIKSKFVTQEQLQGVTTIIGDHETRMRVVESYTETLTGRIWGISATSGLIVSIIGGLVEVYLHYH